MVYSRFTSWLVRFLASTILTDLWRRRRVSDGTRAFNGYASRTYRAR